MKHSFSDYIKHRKYRWYTLKEDSLGKKVANKCYGAEFAKNLGVNIPKLFYKLTHTDEIPLFDDLPDSFVIKPEKGWSSKNVYVIKNGINLFDNKKWTRSEIVSELKKTSDVNVNKNNHILIEEYVENWDEFDGIPLDYKFYMFGEKVAFINVIERNSVNNKLNKFWYLTEKWESLPIKIIKNQLVQSSIPIKPNCFEQMLLIAKKFGRELNMFMRIDLYASKRGVIFGEFTPQPHGGNGYTDEANKWLGSLWRGKEGNDEEIHSLTIAQQNNKYDILALNDYMSSMRRSVIIDFDGLKNAIYNLDHLIDIKKEYPFFNGYIALSGLHQCLIYNNSIVSSELLTGSSYEKAMEIIRGSTIDYNGVAFQAIMKLKSTGFRFKNYTLEHRRYSSLISECKVDDYFKKQVELNHEIALKIGVQFDGFVFPYSDHPPIRVDNGAVHELYLKLSMKYDLVRSYFSKSDGFINDQGSVLNNSHRNVYFKDYNLSLYCAKMLCLDYTADISNSEQVLMKLKQAMKNETIYLTFHKISTKPEGIYSVDLDVLKKIIITLHDNRYVFV